MSQGTHTEREMIQLTIELHTDDDLSATEKKQMILALLEEAEQGGIDQHILDFAFSVRENMNTES